jgi:hypothetical protein
MVLTVSFALSLVTGPSCHHRRRKLVFANLTPASGRQDHTTSPSASSAIRQERISVHRIPPHVRDDRETPLERRRDRIAIILLLPGGQVKFGNSEIYRGRRYAFDGRDDSQDQRSVEDFGRSPRQAEPGCGLNGGLISPPFFAGRPQYRSSPTVRPGNPAASK